MARRAGLTDDGWMWRLPEGGQPFILAMGHEVADHEILRRSRMDRRAPDVALAANLIAGVVEQLIRWLDDQHFLTRRSQFASPLNDPASFPSPRQSLQVLDSEHG